MLRDYPDVHALHFIGDPLARLRASVRAVSPRCVVAGTCARMYLSRSVPGSVALGIARVASVPTLLVQARSIRTTEAGNAADAEARSEQVRMWEPYGIVTPESRATFPGRGG